MLAALRAARPPAGTRCCRHRRPEPRRWVPAERRFKRLPLRCRCIRRGQLVPAWTSNRSSQVDLGQHPSDQVALRRLAQLPVWSRGSVTRETSRMESMPTSLPSSTTGKCRKSPSTMIFSAFSSSASGAIVWGRRVIQCASASRTAEGSWDTARTMSRSVRHEARRLGDRGLGSRHRAKQVPVGWVPTASAHRDLRVQPVSCRCLASQNWSRFRNRSSSEPKAGTSVSRSSVRAEPAAPPPTRRFRL